jgi:hypothetical protein
VHRTPLGVAPAGHQAGLLEYLDVSGDGLLGDGEGSGQVVDGGVAAGEAGDDGPTDGVGQGEEGAVEGVRVGVGVVYSTSSLINKSID